MRYLRYFIPLSVKCDSIRHEYDMEITSEKSPWASGYLGGGGLVFWDYFMHAANILGNSPRKRSE